MCRETTNTALFQRPLPHKTLHGGYQMDDRLSTQLSEALLELPPHRSTVVRQLLMTELYENVMGIVDHDAPAYTVAVPLVRMNPASQTSPYSLYANEVRRLLRLKAPQKTGMGLNELLDLDTESYRIVVNSCSAATYSDSMIEDDLLEQLQEEMQ